MLQNNDDDPMKFTIIENLEWWRNGFLSATVFWGIILGIWCFYEGR